MLGNTNDLGASVFKTWTEKQRSDEIEKLVQGFRNGVPVGILCKMAETVAGSKKNAKKYLKQFMTADERKRAIAAATDSLLPVVKSFLA
ncbi:MAG: hypothetical protein PHN84_07530 [Desulfuromonadaceae bacterium]|nr:hypothetical protein [Desulfuromonadaceae bacterium]MDD2854965.1 hypothetical protein [Desulfuromonadaceae bacterium]